MRVALIGPSQSGKSTVFAAVTGQPPDPAAMDQERIAVVKVPDERLVWLTDLYKPKKTTEATIEFSDLPGFSLVDAHGQAELKRHLPAVRQADALVAVVRGFESETVAPYRDRIDPAADLDELHSEFLFADLEAVTNRVDRIQQNAAKKNKIPEEEKKELVILERCREALENDRPLSDVIHTDEDRKLVSSFQFLTEKPFIAMINVAEDQAAAAPPIQYDQALATIALSAQTEAEIAELPAEDRAAFLADRGVAETAKERWLHTCYPAMGWIAVLTVGEQ